jgi:hypothetical protein
MLTPNRNLLQWTGMGSLLALFFVFPFLFSFKTNEAIKLDLHITSNQLPMLEYIIEDEAYIYFGYVGCTDVCPKALRNIAQKKQLHEESNKIIPTTYFINLIPGLTNQQVSNYTQSTWPELQNVKGLQASAIDLQHIESLFGNYQAGRIGVYNPEMHTDQVFHIKKTAPNEWELLARYPSSKATQLQ